MSAKLAESGPDRSWWQGGLRFACTQCGRCCTGETGYVWLTLADIDRLCAFFGLSRDEFGRRYLRRVGARYALLEHPTSGDCVFFRDRRCSVYAARPAQCRSYPFWPQNLRSERDWERAAEACEGISEEAPVVSARAIADLLSTGDTAAETTT